METACRSLGLSRVLVSCVILTAWVLRSRLPFWIRSHCLKRTDIVSAARERASDRPRGAPAWRLVSPAYADRARVGLQPKGRPRRAVSADLRGPFRGS
jgi:hypothetical protein